MDELPTGERKSFSVPRWSMKKREFTVIIERDEEGYFVAEVPELPGCHTQAKSLDTLMNRVREAIGLCLDEKNEKAPKMQLVGVQRIAV
jgi:predicted RNase H-like HicB family nuclease